MYTVLILGYDYLRNKIRLDLIPYLENYNPNLKRSLISTSRLLADDEDYIDKQVVNGMAQVEFDASNANFVSINNALFNFQHPALQKRLIREAILVIKGNLRSISERHVLNIIQMMNKKNGAKEIHLPENLSAVYNSGTLFICNANYVPFIFKEASADDFVPKNIKIPGATALGFGGLYFKIKQVEKKDVKLNFATLNKVYLDYDKTGSEIKIRLFRPGDRFSPLGMKGTKKLKSFFIDEKVPRNQRKSIPLLTTRNDDIIWVYEKRIGEYYKITDKSTNILLVEGVVNQKDFEKSLMT